MSVSGEISLGSLATALSVLISAAALAYGWRKDQQLRRKEYADRIRRAAGTIAAKLDRWPAVVMQFFDNVQPLFLEFDHVARQGEETAQARHELLRGLYEQRATASQRIADEEIEHSYVDLYGYDPRIHQLFLGAVNRIKAIDERTFAQVRTIARETVSSGSSAAGETQDALRQQLTDLALTYEQEANEIVDAFRREMLKLIVASDHEILAQTVSLSAAADVLPGEAKAARRPDTLR